MQLSIVVGTYNRLDQLKACIDSVVAETRTPFVLYVTDAGSTDGTQEYLASVASERIRPILVGKKLGQAKAYNDVFFQVDTPYVCWISDDNVIVGNGLDVGVRILRENPRFGMVGLKVRDKEGPFVDAPYIGGLSMLGILNVNQGMLPTAVLKAVGGFSETFRDYGIDPDLTAKVLYGGWDIAYTRAVAIHHYRNWSVDKSSPEYAVMQERQKRYLAMYKAKYEPLTGSDAATRLKQALWNRLTRRFPALSAVNAHEPVFGALPRDWKNAFNGRYINALDPLLTRGKPYHLVQHCPRSKLPKTLPQDAPLAAE